MHIVAREQGSLTEGVWTTDAYVKGKDGRVRATKAAQVASLVTVPSSEHYYKESTMEARAEKKREREAKADEERAERERRNEADRKRRAAEAAERDALVAAANKRRDLVPERHAQNKYCVCDKPQDAFSGGNMVHCSRCKDWFHFDCVSYKPSDVDRKGTRWYCSVCSSISAQKQRKQETIK